MWSFAEVRAAEHEAQWSCAPGEEAAWDCADADASKITSDAAVAVDSAKLSAEAAEPEIPAESELPDLALLSTQPLAPIPTLTDEALPNLGGPVALGNEQPPAAEAMYAEKIAEAGWQCAGNPDDEGWRCLLRGPDPEGEAREVSRPASSWFGLGPVFKSTEERHFKTIRARLPYDPWRNCGSEMGVPADFVSTSDQREATPLEIKSDYSEVFDNEITGFFGHVDIERADQRMLAQTLHYDTVSQTLDAQGNVFYSDDAIAFKSDTLMLNTQNSRARIRDMVFIAPQTPIRGRAGTVFRDSQYLSRYTDVAFTSCRPGNNDWAIHASDLKLNKDSGQGAARNAWLEFKGIPLAYTPYISFPLDDRRLTGFLTPSFGFSDKNGADVEIPFYWNIAPNYDATLRPRYVSERGPMFGATFRHLSALGPSSIAFDVLPDDDTRGRSRYMGSVKNISTFNPYLRSEFDANIVSDDDYFNDLGSNISFADTRFLRSHANIQYQKDQVRLLALAENYQTIDKTITAGQKPYQRVPQVRADVGDVFDFGFGPLQAQLATEFVNFRHRTLTDGLRFDVHPSLSMPLIKPGAFVVPKVSVRYTRYDLSGQQPGQDSAINRTLPMFSLDSGLILEREMDLFGSDYVHTLEPRLFYLFVPRDQQSDIPLFDTSEFDFNFDSLFRENRFSGSDRVNDANQLTAAITTRLNDQETGREILRASLGEIFFFRDRSVCLVFNPDGSCNLDGGVLVSPFSARHELDDRFSNMIAEVAWQMTDTMALKLGQQWDPIRNQSTRTDVVFHYNDRGEQIFNIAYRRRKDLLEQSDVSMRWPLFDDWYFVGRWQYSWFFNSSIESFAGFEKESCCWRFRIIGRRFVNTIDTLIGQQQFQGDSQNGVFVQLELKGLTAFGINLMNFLRKTLLVTGVRKTSPSGSRRRVLSAGFVWLGVALLLATSVAAAQALDYIVAIAEDDVILASELKGQAELIAQRMAAAQMPLPPQPILRRQVLEKLILEALQRQLAAQAGIKATPDMLNAAVADIARQNGMDAQQFRTQLASQGMSVKAFEESIADEMIINQLRGREVGGRVKVSDRELEHFLETGGAQALDSARYHLAHILIAVPEGAAPEVVGKASKQADELVAQLQAGADFTQLAMAQSASGEALQGGDLGWRDISQVPSLFVDVVDQLAQGEVSTPIRSPSGFHIVKMVARKGGEQRHVTTKTRARHILIKTNELIDDQTARQRLLQLSERVRQGENFAELARKYSEDKGSALKGGELGWVEPGALVPEFEKTMNALALGELSAPVQTQFGWHLIEVLERKSQDDSDDFKKERLREMLRQRKIEEETELWLRRLRDQSYVKIFEDRL
ncbi:MAG: LPS assembly protein LptD [Methylococcales bacterium]|nr:LPS assembly protein LptD [Methylococcales bacterium]